MLKDLTPYHLNAEGVSHAEGVTAAQPFSFQYQLALLLQPSCLQLTA